MATFQNSKGRVSQYNTIIEKNGIKAFAQAFFRKSEPENGFEFKFGIFKDTERKACFKVLSNGGKYNPTSDISMLLELFLEIKDEFQGQVAHCIPCDERRARIYYKALKRANCNPYFKDSCGEKFLFWEF